MAVSAPVCAGIVFDYLPVLTPEVEDDFDIFLNLVMVEDSSILHTFATNPIALIRETAIKA